MIHLCINTFWLRYDLSMYKLCLCSVYIQYIYLCLNISLYIYLSILWTSYISWLLDWPRLLWRGLVLIESWVWRIPCTQCPVPTVHLQVVVYTRHIQHTNSCTHNINNSIPWTFTLHCTLCNPFSLQLPGFLVAICFEDFFPSLISYRGEREQRV